MSPTKHRLTNRRLTKHHGLGNDFLVLLDLDWSEDVDGDVARGVCDRRRGVGADGLIHVGPGTDGADVAMALYNADGGRAEMSGNGIRCLGQAVAMLRDGQRGQDSVEITVATGGGLRRVAVGPDDGTGTRLVTVDMGAATLHQIDDRAAEVDMGNPHLVLRRDDVAGVDLLVLGRQHPEVNVEVIAVGPRPDELELRVYERGAGVTEACGTGSCAAAVAAGAWGLVGPEVLVHNPGGDLSVTVKPDAVLLTGPATYVAAVELGPGGPWR